MSTVSAKCGHVKRHLSRNEPLNGEVLEFALSCLPDEGSPADNELLGGIRQKLLSGSKLTEYEYHVFVEVILLHVRLGAASEERTRASVER